MVFPKKTKQTTTKQSGTKKKKKKEERSLCGQRGEGNYHKIWHGKSVHESTVGEMWLCN